MEYIVDIQGFRCMDNEFVSKEVAILKKEVDSTPLVYTFKPPFHWAYLCSKNKCTNRWLQINHLGMRWNSGEIPYERLRKILNQTLGDASIIYVKGEEKRTWLLSKTNIRAEVIDLHNMGCPSLKYLSKLQMSCSNHADFINYACAVKNALALRNWVLYNEQPIPLTRNPIPLPRNRSPDEGDCGCRERIG